MMIHQRSKLAAVTRSSRPSWLLPLVLALGLSGLATQTLAQAPAAPSQAAPAQSAAELDKLVASIALYPDDLVGLVLPASTFPLEIVQADRYLDKRKADPKAPVNESWDDTVKSLLNYPEVIKKMSADLDWTSKLGEAVVADQGAVLEAIQRFRRQTQAAGNLKSDDKQVIVVEKEVIKIVPADPQVIYVPQYNPSTVVVYGGYSSWGYYPTPYPVYYYPYAPGAAFTVGLIWGAAISSAWHGGHYVTHYGGGGGNQINIDRSNNINVGNGSGNGNRNNGNRGNSATQWKSDKKPGEVRSPSDRGSNRVGDSQGGRGSDRAGAGNRASTQPAQGARGGDRAGDRGGQPSVSDRAGGGDRAGSGSRQGGGDAFGSYGSGRDARADSARGASSRQSSAGSRSSAGGARSSGGRAGGGGRGGRR